MPRPKIELPPEQLLTRQINYTIIRQLWNRVDVSPALRDKGIYSLLYLTPNRYTRIVQGIPTYLGNDELTQMQKTGLSREIFDGTKVLDLRIAPIEEKRKHFISAAWDFWVDYFSDSKEDQDTAGVQAIKKALKELDSNYVRNHYMPGDELYRLLMFFVTGKVSDKDPILLELSFLGDRMANITWEQLANITGKNDEVLTSYIYNLEQALELAKAYRTYRQAIKVKK